jgi:hypothetical protein
MSYPDVMASAYAVGTFPSLFGNIPTMRVGKV